MSIKSFKFYNQDAIDKKISALDTKITSVNSGLDLLQEELTNLQNTTGTVSTSSDTVSLYRYLITAYTEDGYQCSLICISSEKADKIDFNFLKSHFVNGTLFNGFGYPIFRLENEDSFYIYNNGLQAITFSDTTITFTKETI